MLIRVPDECCEGEVVGRVARNRSGSVPADARRGVGQVVLEYDERDDVKEAEHSDR